MSYVLTAWMFRFDHYNYARWLSVYPVDLKELRTKTRKMFEQKTFLVSQSNKYAKNSGVYLDLHPVLQCFKVVSSWIRDYQHVANRE